MSQRIRLAAFIETMSITQLWKYTSVIYRRLQNSCIPYIKCQTSQGSTMNMLSTTLQSSP